MPCAWAVVLTRFVPVVRTVVNPLAAATGMSAGRFAASQGGGSLVWKSGRGFAGDLLGTTVSRVEDHLVALVTFLVVLPVVPVLLKNRRARAAASGLERNQAR